MLPLTSSRSSSRGPSSPSLYARSRQAQRASALARPSARVSTPPARARKIPGSASALQDVLVPSDPLSHHRPPHISSTPTLPRLLAPQRDHRSAFDNLSDEEPIDNVADVLSEVVLAIDMKNNGTIGCAYYVVVDEALYLQEDISMAGVELVETILLHVQPTTVLVSNRAADALSELLQNGAQSINDDRSIGEHRGAYVLRPIPSTELNYEAGKEKLVNLELDYLDDDSAMLLAVPDDPMDAGGPSRQNKLMRLGTLINLDSRISIACAAAVLGDINRRRAAEILPGDQQGHLAFRVKSIEMFTLANSMFINADSLASLQILRSESHPNSQMQGPDKSKSGAKENLSIYGLVQAMSCTPQGRVKLRRMFLRPTLDLDLLRERQKSIALLLRPENTETMETIVKKLRRIKNIKTSLLHLRRGVDQPNAKKSVQNGVWMALSRFSRFSVELREAVRCLSGGADLAIVNKIHHDIDAREIIRVGELICQTIDFEQSKESNRTAVLPGVDSKLDELKRNYDGLDHFLSRVASRLTQEIPEWAVPYIHSCTFFPQLGFLTAVQLNPETGKGNYDGEGLVGDVWESMFVNEGFIYYKNRMMKGLDEQVGDVYCMIVDKEIEIVHELGIQVLRYEEAIITASEIYGELDCLVALALAAGRYDWTEPRMTSANTIRIQGGRHPLQELVVPSFIPNDCRISGGDGKCLVEDDIVSANGSKHADEPSLLVLTGPNHSGKSVYLKQVALIVYMAHIGSYVPASHATVGLTDRILTRLCTRESVSRSESAFAIDLKQAAFSMNFATRQSLILVDEFGKGTNAHNGTGLLTALLGHFLDLGDERPKVLAASHFHEIFENGFLQESERGLAFAHMDVRLDLDAQDADDKVQYLFRLIPGRSLSSFGSRCAAMNGVDDAVVARADALALLMARNEDLQVACAKLSEEEERRLEQAELVARRFLMKIPPRGDGARPSGNKDRTHARDKALSLRNLLDTILSPRRDKRSTLGP